MAFLEYLGRSQRRFDLREVERSHLVTSWLLGACFGIGAAIFNSVHLMLIFIPITSETTVEVFSLNLVTILVPFIEEITKLIPVFFLKNQENLDLDVDQWIYLGVFSALGFSVLENILYFLTFVNMYGYYAGFWLLLLRFLLTTPMHLTSTTIASYGAGEWDNCGEPKYLGFILIAIIIHSLFNYITFIMAI